MLRSTDRILVTHQGTLPRPADIREMLIAQTTGQAIDQAAFQRRVAAAVAEGVKQQAAIGIDCVNDGELGKTTFNDYVRERLGGLAPTDEPYVSHISGRDLKEFPEYFSGPDAFGGRPRGGIRRVVWACTGPITYTGQAMIQRDIDTLKAALQGVNVPEAYLPAIAPGSVEHWLRNAYYKSDEEYLFALTDALRVEYKAIIDAGFIVQIDDPDLADGWQVNPTLTKDEYRRYAAIRVDALNHALRDLPEDRVRFHVCWGSYHGPHKFDIPLADIVDLILNIKAQAYSIEASNPAHDHDWHVWEDVKFPTGKILVPGVIGHCSDFIEHPQLVADRLIRYANLVGRENVIAGTDCGIGSRVGHGKVCWAKFESMVEGARIASKALWG